MRLHVSWLSLGLRLRFWQDLVFRHLVKSRAQREADWPSPASVEAFGTPNYGAMTKH